jgi:hypothetical protein
MRTRFAFVEEVTVAFATDPVYPSQTTLGICYPVGSFATKNVAQDFGTRLPLRSRRVNASS